MTLAFLSLQQIFIGLPFLIIVLYTLYHILNNRTLTTGNKILWFFAVLIFNLLGTLAYWLFGRNTNFRVDK